MQGSRVGEFEKKRFYKSPSCLQNTALLSLLAVVRVQSSPEEQCVLSAMRIITQLWLRMSPDQVRSQYTHAHTHRCKCMTVNPAVTCHPPGADPPCSTVYSAAAPVNIGHFSEKH